MEIYPVQPKLALNYLFERAKSAVTPHRTIMAMRMRIQAIDEYWQLIDQLMESRRKNMSGHFRAACLTLQHELYSSKEFIAFDNGVTKFSGRYYVVAKDRRNGNKCIYWSHDPKRLAFETDEYGDNYFIHDNGRYFWRALSWHATDEDIRKSMRAHDERFRDYHRHHATSYGGNVSNQHSIKRFNEDWRENDVEKYGHRYETHAFSNDDYAMAVRENPRKYGGRWSVEIAAQFERFHALKGFVEIDQIPFFRKWTKAFFSNGYHSSTHNTREEAFATLYMNGDKRSRLTWIGENPLYEKKVYATKLFTSAWNIAAKQLQSNKNKEDVGFDAFVAIATAAATKTLLRLTFVSFLSTAVAINFAMRKASQIAGFVRKEWGWYKNGAASVDPIRALYVLPTRANVFVRKLNTNIRPVSNEYLSVLNGEQDISYDNKEQISKKEPFKIAKILTHLGQSGYSNLCSPIDDYTATEIFYNGFVRLARRDPKTKDLVFYVKYIEALDVNTNISLGEDVKALFRNGEIMKIHHKKNTDQWHIGEVSYDVMENDVCGKLFEDHDHIDDSAAHAARGHIDWLFNNQAQHNIAEVPEPDFTSNISKIEKLRPKRKGILNKILGDHEEIKKPSKALVAFFKDCVFPHPSTMVRRYAALTPSI